MPSPRARSSSLPARLLAGLIVLVIGIWLGGHPSWMPSGLRSAFVANGNDVQINDVLNLLTHDYYRPIKRSQLLDKGLSAMVASLGDPYSHYYDAASYHSFLNETNPHLSGIGVDVQLETNGLRVVDVFPGSPAARAGLERGDLIVAVGSHSLANNVSAGSALIRGQAGTRVGLTVLRGSRKLSFSISRANIVVPVAASNIVTYKGVKLGYLRLTSFTQSSGDELRAQVSKVLREGAHGLILDLRENGGGLLQEAINVASIFIPDGTIVSTYGRAQPRQVYTAEGNAIAPKLPMVVLVDGGTASSAEIVTAALQQRGRAKVVGTHTYGKGVFQEIEPLPDGAALDFTVGEYFTPNGENLGGGGVKQGRGIIPTVYAVSNPRSTKDTALDVAERTVAAEIH